MCNITKIQDTACFRGSLTSLLADSGCDENHKDEILNKLTLFQDSENSNVIYIDPSNLPDLLSNIFLNSQVFSLRDISDIQNLEFCVDNSESFALLFWQGNNIQLNRHVTRYISHSENSVLLMDPQNGEIINFDYSNLNNISPNGFKLVHLAKS